MAKTKILMVDDEPGITRMVKRSLEATNRFDVRTENVSSVALNAAREFQPDLILLDVMMPGIDGGEVAARMKADDSLKEVPIVYLTAIVKKDEVEAAGGVIGGHVYLAKPIKLNELIDCIEEQLAGKNATEE